MKTPTRAVIVVAAVLLAVASLTAAQTVSGAQYAGVWSGSWEGGGGSGGFELTLDAPKDGKIAGRVSVTGEPTYKAEIKTLSFDGAKLTAKYDFPDADNLEVVLNGTFDGKNVAGTWSAREKGSDGEVASGTWKAARQ
jgi:hypothetical protein